MTRGSASTWSAAGGTRVSGNVTLTFELTSENEYRSVLVNGRIKDDTGTFLDTGTASLVEVKPGQTYRAG